MVWSRKFGVILLLLSLLAIGSWFALTRYVRSEIANQLAELELGDVQIGRVSVYPGGISANQVQIFKETDTDRREPWVTVNSLRIEHPLMSLAAGAKRYNAVVADGAEIHIDVNALMEDSNESQFSLKDLELPADEVRVSDANVWLHGSGQEGRQKNLKVEGLHAVIKNGPELQLTGSIEDLVNGAWQISGVADPNRDSAEVRVTSKSVSLQTDQWSAWPLLPSGLEQAVTADGTVAVAIVVNLAESSSPNFQADVSIDSLNLDFQTLDFPLKLAGGKVVFANGRIDFSDIVAKPFHGGEIVGRGQTLVSSFPIQSTFSGQFQDVPVRTWRQVVQDIPGIASGSTSGTFEGAVAVETSLGSTINIDATAKVQDASYGQVSADKLSVNLDLEQLVFDEQQLFKSVAGTVEALGTFTDQSAKDAFSTFDLTDLKEQLAIVGNASGELAIKLPLSTVGDINTWNIAVNAEIPNGSIANQPLENVVAPVRVKNGILATKSIIATLPDGMSKLEPENAVRTTKPQIEVDIKWPLTDRTKMKDRGSVEAKGKLVDSLWLYGFVRHQIASASGDVFEPASDAFNKLGGRANFEVSLSIPALDPAAIDQWSATAAIDDSEFAFDNTSLSAVSSNMTVKNLILDINGFEGQFSEGNQLNANGQIDLNKLSDIKLSVATTQMPVAWAIKTTRMLESHQLIPGLSAKNSTENWQKQIQSILTEEDIEGSIDAEIDITSTRSVDDELDWRVKAAVDSQGILIGENRIQQLKLDLAADSAQVELTEINIAIDNASVEGSGTWDIDAANGSGTLEWDRLPIDWLAATANVTGINTGGISKGQIIFSPRDLQEPNAIPVSLSGGVALDGLSIEQLRLRPLEFDIKTEGDQLVLSNLRSGIGQLGLKTIARIGLSQPHEFNVDGQFEKIQLSQIVSPASVIDANDRRISLTGTVDGTFDASGSLRPFVLRTNGIVKVERPTINLQDLGDVEIDWQHSGDDWAQSKMLINAFGGKFEMKELSNAPQRVRLKMEGVDAEQLSKMVDLPVDVSGKLDGEATLNDWSLSDTRRFDVDLSGSSIVIRNSEFGDFRANASLKSYDLKYEMSGSLLSGKVEASGETTIDENSLSTTEFPLQLSVKNAALESLHGRSNQFRSLRPLSGRLAGTAKLVVDMDGGVNGEGRISLGDVKWAQNIVTREASVRVKIDNDKVVFDDVKADLKRGTISARASVPLTGELGGTYELNVNHLDLERLTKVFRLDELEAVGLVDLRVGGLIGRQVTGRGYVGVDRASLHGVAGQSLRLPIEYQFSPLDQSGRIELRRSKFRLFDGKVSGTGRIDFGRRLDVSTDLELTNVNTGDLIEAAADFHDFDQGKLSGKVKLNGRGVRSARDLKGSFKGKLSRADAFQLPVLSDIGRVISRQNIANNEFDSDEILLALNRGRIEVKNLNFQNSLAQIAITGSAYVDGRLDLRVAGRVEQLDQPTLIDELLGSPLTNFGGTPTAFAAQAAEFLSDRVVFLSVGGTFERPQVRVDSPQQLREETIRYFLRDSKIFPFQIQRNN